MTSKEKQYLETKFDYLMSLLVSRIDVTKFDGLLDEADEGPSIALIFCRTLEEYYHTKSKTWRVWNGQKTTYENIEFPLHYAKYISDRIDNIPRLYLDVNKKKNWIWGDLIYYFKRENDIHPKTSK